MRYRRRTYSSQPAFKKMPTPDSGCVTASSKVIALTGLVPVKAKTAARRKSKFDFTVNTIMVNQGGKNK